MYTQFAKWYDFHYRSIKDYPAEAERIAYILEKFETQPKGILDVACGTGEHARILSETYGYCVDGIDLEPNFVEIAQSKNPGGEFTAADMRSFTLQSDTTPSPVFSAQSAMRKRPQDWNPPFLAWQGT